MSNAAQEPRRWTFTTHAGAAAFIEASAYDALLAERDALSVEVVGLRAQVAEGRANLVKQFTAALAVDMELRAELAALKEKAERLQEKLRDSFVDSDGCDLCDLEWPYSHDEQHAPDCPAHPDFLTTSATESRGAKGGNA